MFGGVIWSGDIEGGDIFHGCGSGGDMTSFGAGCWKGSIGLPGFVRGIASALVPIIAVGEGRDV